MDWIPPANISDALAVPPSISTATGPANGWTRRASGDTRRGFAAMRSSVSRVRIVPRATGSFRKCPAMPEIITAAPPPLPRRSRTIPSSSRNSSTAASICGTRGAIQKLNQITPTETSASADCTRRLAKRVNRVGRLPSLTGWLWSGRSAISKLRGRSRSSSTSMRRTTPGAPASACLTRFQTRKLTLSRLSRSRTAATISSRASP